MAESPFFTLHRDLPREGPGCRADLDAAIAQITLSDQARILDAGCGPGADIGGLLAHAPDGHVTAVDGCAQFIDQVKERWGADPRVTALCCDMLDQTGPFDLIWSAGALYFLGIERALSEMYDRLTPGGALIFSELVFLVPDPDEPLRRALETEYADIGPVPRLEARVRAAGFDLIASSTVSDDAWEAYYTPLDQRIEMLRPEAGADLAKVLDDAVAEAAMWRANKRAFGYAQIVAVKPS